MEEVWKDISLTSLNDHSVISNTNSNHSAFPSMIFQDFLARPLNKELPPRRNSTVVSIAEETSPFGSLEPTPGTILSLNSGSDFQYLETTTVDPLRPNPAVMNGHGAPPFGSPTAFPSFCKRRAQENNENSVDRRHKRMMKNRESAARSRARKQAYTNELELEVAHLIEENAKLKRQQEVRLLAAPPQLPKKSTLSRSLTAPF
ncbi:hypothetical protein CCACVL1_09099 [Corchorus capsularis]|uniref:BZIP domain-containing protein n=1 Tax=Corchorus capsularis TaxID=210143 RepID=A0A1R3IXQ5_COCAP|nr:hypothetical protein CCACVL1_09099 [Corchorus capsularis]